MFYGCLCKLYILAPKPKPVRNKKTFSKKKKTSLDMIYILFSSWGQDMFSVNVLAILSIPVTMNGD